MSQYPSWKILDEVLLSHLIYFAINKSERKLYATDGGRVTMRIDKFLESIIGGIDDTKALTDEQANWLSFMNKRDTKSKSRMSSREIVIVNSGKNGLKRDIIFSIRPLNDHETNTMIEECGVDVLISLCLEEMDLCLKDVVNVALKEVVKGFFLQIRLFNI